MKARIYVDLVRQVLKTLSIDLDFNDEYLARGAEQATSLASKTDDPQAEALALSLAIELDRARMAMGRAHRIQKALMGREPEDKVDALLKYHAADKPAVPDARE